MFDFQRDIFEKYNIDSNCPHLVIVFESYNREDDDINRYWESFGYEVDYSLAGCENYFKSKELKGLEPCTFGWAEFHYDRFATEKAKELFKKAMDDGMIRILRLSVNHWRDNHYVIEVNKSIKYKDGMMWG